jgi:transcription antitermination protein NusB
MGARTTARESALQILFAIDATEGDPEQAILDYWRETPGDAEGRVFADALVRGVFAHRERIDEIVSATSTHWRIERMNPVDRNILRLGAYELWQSTDVPRPVILDEAIELAKRYGTEQSGAFVNGVLDQIADQLGRPAEDGTEPTHTTK